MEPIVYRSNAAFPNVCTHRGAVLLERPSPSLRCPYHGRQYGSDGTLRIAPGCPTLPRGEDLPLVAVETLGPWTFARITGERPLPNPARWLSGLPLETLRRDPTGDRVYTIEAHWALWVENYLEGLHVPFVHPGLRATLDLGGYRTKVEDQVIIQVGVSKDPPFLNLPEGHPAGDRVGGLYLYLFPCTALNVYAWGVSVNVIEPVSATRTNIHYERWTWREVEGGPGGALDDVEQEDDAIVERVARGIAALNARGGKLGSYVPGWEDGARAFHGWLAGL